MTGVLSIQGVRRHYGPVAAVDDLTLELEAGRLTCLLGPSGCGKSTLLRLIAGLEPVDAGQILMGSRTLSGPSGHVPAEDRRFGLVFQDQALFPHMTVAENVAFGLHRLPKADRDARVMNELERVRLAHRANARPRDLSGGEQQRVALARALAPDPRLLLLDEPFAGLDGPLRSDLRDAVLPLLREAGVTVLIVTHDAEEAMMMADTLALMDQGRILQTGAPRDCYQSPASAHAARLLGPINVLPARLEAGLAKTALGDVPAGPAHTVVLARPEALIVGNEGCAAIVTGVKFAGGSVLVELSTPTQTLLVRMAPQAAPATGDRVQVRLAPDLCSTAPG